MMNFYAWKLYSVLNTHKICVCFFVDTLKVYFFAQPHMVFKSLCVWLRIHLETASSKFFFDKCSRAAPVVPNLLSTLLSFPQCPPTHFSSTPCHFKTMPVLTFLQKCEVIRMKKLSITFFPLLETCVASDIRLPNSNLGCSSSFIAAYFHRSHYCHYMTKCYILRCFRIDAPIYSCKIINCLSSHLNLTFM